MVAGRGRLHLRNGPGGSGHPVSDPGLPPGLPCLTGMLDDHHCGLRHIHAHLHHSGAAARVGCHTACRWTAPPAAPQQETRTPTHCCTVPLRQFSCPSPGPAAPDQELDVPRLEPLQHAILLRRRHLAVQQAAVLARKHALCDQPLHLLRGCLDLGLAGLGGCVLRGLSRCGHSGQRAGTTGWAWCCTAHPQGRAAPPRRTILSDCSTKGQTM